MKDLIDILSWFFLSAGGALVLVGGIGVLRMPDFYTRIHPASITDTMAAFLVLSGIVLQAGFSLATIKVIAIFIFLLFTSPTATYALANAARVSGLKPFFNESEGNEP